MGARERERERESVHVCVCFGVRDTRIWSLPKHRLTTPYGRVQVSVTLAHGPTYTQYNHVGPRLPPAMILTLRSALEVE